MTVSGALVLRFHIPARLVSMNERMGREQGRARQAWIAMAKAAALAAHPGVGPSGRRRPSSVVQCELPVRDRRRRDPINYAPVVKWIVDGLVYADLWPDDTAEHVDQRTPILHRDYPWVVVRITPFDEARPLMPPAHEIDRYG